MCALLKLVKHFKLFSQLVIFLIQIPMYFYILPQVKSKSTMDFDLAIVAEKCKKMQETQITFFKRKMY